jgi:hypothetical protein
MGGYTGSEPALKKGPQHICKKKMKKKKNIRKELMTNKGCSYLGSPPGVGGV